MIPALVGASLGVGVPPSNFYSIATATVTSGGIGTITFNSIPSGYTHLQIRANPIWSATDQTGYVQFNGDTASNYFYHRLIGTGSGTPVSQATPSATYIGALIGAAATAPVYSATIIDILDYGSTSKNKTLRALAGADANGAGYITLMSGAWNNSSTAVSSITLFPGSGSFNQYSSFALYGVK